MLQAKLECYNICVCIYKHICIHLYIHTQTHEKEAPIFSLLINIELLLSPRY